MRSHPYASQMTSHQQMVYGIRQQLNAQQFPTPMSSSVRTSMSQIMPNNTEINNTSNQSNITPDMRPRSGFSVNPNSMRPELRGQPQFAGYLPNQPFDYRNQMPRQMPVPSYGMVSQNQRPDISYTRPSSMMGSAISTPIYSTNTQHRLLDRALSAPTQRPYPYHSLRPPMEGTPYCNPSAQHSQHRDQQSVPSLRPPFMSSPVESSQKRITLEAKQSTEIRDKLLMQSMTTNRPIGHLLGGGHNDNNGQQFNAMMRVHHQKVFLSTIFWQSIECFVRKDRKRRQFVE